MLLHVELLLSLSPLSFLLAPLRLDQLCLQTTPLQNLELPHILLLLGFFLALFRLDPLCLLTMLLCLELPLSLSLLRFFRAPLRLDPLRQSCLLTRFFQAPLSLGPLPEHLHNPCMAPLLGDALAATTIFRGHVSAHSEKLVHGHRKIEGRSGRKSEIHHVIVPVACEAPVK